MVALSIQEVNLQFLQIFRTLVLVLIGILFLSGCSGKSSKVSYEDSSNTKTMSDSPNVHKATMRPYTVFGKTYYPTMVNVGDTYSGDASWYGKDFHGKKTANGETYNMNALTAAHKTLPMNTMVKVTNQKNGKSVVVRINDRGPFVANRIIDMSKEGASRLDFMNQGIAKVKLEILGFAGTVASDTSSLTSEQKSVVINDFDVQIGAFRNLSGAKTYQDQFSYQDGRYKAIIKEGVHEGQMMYRIWLQGFGSEDEARDFISSGRYPGSFIVREK